MAESKRREATGELVARWQRSVLETRNAAESLAALPGIFDSDLTIMLNGQKLGWSWLEQHMHELHLRLRNIRVEVTHAAREGRVILERHIVNAIARDSGSAWQAEVQAVYELSSAEKIRTWYELASIPGTYTGW